ncbi:MAG TPA: phosphatidylglycerol lysyltransferase domain-containing protein [Ktedonobacteraceae bacterium]
MDKQVKEVQFSFPSPAHTATRRVIALIICLVGMADMLSAIVPKLNWDILLGAWPLTVHRVHAQTLTVVVGFFLIMLSYGLARGKKHAWRITLFLLLLSVWLHVLRSGSVLATIVALGLAALLASLSSFFQARSDPPSVWRGYTILALGLGIVVFDAIVGFLALYDNLEPLIDRFGLDGAILRILTQTHLRYWLHGTPAIFFGRALPWLCISAVLYGMVQLFHPVAAVLLPNMEKRNQACKHVQLYGTNSISYFALDADKSYFFSESGKSVMSYVLEGSTAVVAGDPIGPEDEMALILKQFINFCTEQDWTIVLWQVRAEFMPLYRTAGLHLLKIGEDAVIDVQKFTLKGGTMANVRSSAKRAEKDGLQVVFYRGSVTDVSQRTQMERISATWLASKGGSEMGFSMGHFDPQGDKEQLTALAVDNDDKVHAFVTFVPIYGRHGWGLDLMRRAPQPAPGTMELLLARSLEYMKSCGTEMASLGLAPLSNANAEEETFLGNSIDFLTGRFGDPEKNQSLFNFKKKFQPTWESRYLVYSSTLSLPRIGWALYHAHQRDASLLRTIGSTVNEWRHKRQCTTGQATRALETANI